MNNLSKSAQLRNVYAHGRFGLSYEFFPPKTAEGEADLFENFSELVKYNASFATCTYGAGGSTRDKTLEIAGRLKREYALPVASHLTCVGAARDTLAAYLQRAEAVGIDYIVALRGDPPNGEKKFSPVPGGFSYANELVAFIREQFPGFGVAVAGYPETHPEAPNRTTDLENLKRKVDAGADVVITQLFYDNDDFYRFRERCAAIGIGVPIVPGILPVTAAPQVKRLVAMCGANVPKSLMERLETHPDHSQGQFDVGVYHAIRQVEDLVSRGGCPGVHFYCLNKSRAVATILRTLTLPNVEAFRNT
ncbi:MAG TPA: methylenetetrahydrofolate reductase [NAD(P)H] [Candidatus Hydrogenedentes bacterium]|nr:methylenetetrahydrofolate reductase [NAD(P)H] [FCB group bacterium]HNV20305.1 methylenetetrahydrofolate reductase [NAD(P)H] [Candidatus Hydrogenedentota bacterium]HNZ17576.1 methylenetetrahydrofolate reductase [NAD(P)H] [Candidatus Hydrogenedentota bacterium]HOH33321.1 methylenetetrahydrofolate reductase [NAD(P)H] [Candidatus Hydrogenedentota bacterium]HPA03090.1 methylenetetrahydrofolate reductase [NAD(P)H] [Candidatus Hydrogenedentota bacterium]